MDCNILKFKGCQIKGSTFSGVRINFPDRDISGDTFFLLLKSQGKQIKVDGIISEDNVLFPYSSLESLMPGKYDVDFWANFDGIGLKPIATQDLHIAEMGSGSNCCGNIDDFPAVIDTGDISISYTVSFSIINVILPGGNVSWSNVTDKPLTFTPPVADETTLGGVRVWFGTQIQYDAIGAKVSDTIYYIQS